MIRKPQAKEIVILGAGPSLDYSDPTEYEPRPDRLTIAINATAVLARADYFVATDVISIRNWNHYVDASAFVVVPAFRRPAAAAYPSLRVLTTDQMLRGLGVAYKVAGSLSVAFAVALFLLRRIQTIERVAYIGCDYARVRDDRGVWNYAGRLRKYYSSPQREMSREDPSLPIRSVMRIPAEQRREGMDAVAYCYGVQHMAIHRLFQLWRPNELSRLESRSFTDIRILAQSKIVTPDVFIRARREIADNAS